MKVKKVLYKFVPSPFKKSVKNFYYGRILFPFHSLKHKFLYGEWDFFDTIAIETTTYCNLRCKFCPNSKYERGLLENKKLMDADLFKKIIDDLSEIRFRGNVDLYYYGEPLTDERLPEFVEYARKKLPKANIEINSNGFLLTLEIYKVLVEKGLDKINVTQYTKVEPQGTLKVMHHLNTHHNMKKIITYRVLNENELSNRGGEIELEVSPNYERPICRYPNAPQSIDYAGNWVLCCNDYHSTVKFGNLRHESLMDIWKKLYFKKIRKETRNGIFNLPICKECTRPKGNLASLEEKNEGKKV